LQRESEREREKERERGQLFGGQGVRKGYVEFLRGQIDVKEEVRGFVVAAINTDIYM